MKKTHIIIILFLSITINLGLILKEFYSTYEIAQNIKINETKEAYISRIYDISLYFSTSYENQNLEKRINKLYEQYLKDVTISQEQFYDKNGKILDFWKKKCEFNIRKINGISGKIDLIEAIITKSVGQDEKVQRYFEAIIERRAYHDKLRDMSNFYAKFLPEYQLELIQTTTD